MTFEEQVNEYLLTMVNNNIFIDADIIGISEIHNRATVKAIFNGENELSEKFIIVYKTNDSFTWNFIKFADQADYENLTNESNDWIYKNFNKRVVINATTLTNNNALQIWYKFNNYPFINKNDIIYIYCQNIPVETLDLLLSSEVEINNENQIYTLQIPEYNASTHKLGEIYFDEVNNLFTRYIIELTPVEIEQKKWHYKYPKRLIAPRFLLNQYPSVTLQILIRNLPIVEDEINDVYILYMNQVAPEHQAVVDAAQGYITIETYPE